MKERLHKTIAASTKLSRRAAEKAISKGEVTVDGSVVTKQGTLVDPEKNVIRWKRRRITRPREKFYLAYHKPKSMLVTKSDPEGRRTIWKDLEEFKARANAVGRLDYDSEGLLIITNDGDLINKLTHPKHDVEKKYQVKVKGMPTTEKLTLLKKGIAYRGVKYRGASIETRKKTGRNTWLDVTISEGKYRQIKMMFKAIGYPVTKLKRVRLGSVKLGNLAPSKWRPLTKGEVSALLKFGKATP